MNKYDLILFLPALGILSWIVSIYLVRSWEYFWLYFGINLMVLTAYTVYIWNADLNFLGHDEYRLGKLLILIALPICHAILGFGIAIVVNSKTKMREIQLFKS